MTTIEFTYYLCLGQQRAEEVQPRQQEGAGPVRLLLRAEGEAHEAEGKKPTKKTVLFYRRKMELK